MNFTLKKSTGSISQDALRLGFQTTCNKGIAQLLKVDSITVEECSAFKERHLEELKNNLQELIEEQKNKLISDFSYNMRFPEFYMYRKLEPFNSIPILGWISYKSQLRAHKKTSARVFTIKILEVEEPEVDILAGKWVSKINFEVTAQPWSGYIRGVYTEHELKVFIDYTYYKTNARKCTVDYVNYDNYHEKYIPDDAVEAAFQAKQIGMEKLMVASPIVTNTTTPQRDPIIVGHIGEQMFIIAWFGYDKTNHMSCNS